MPTKFQENYMISFKVIAQTRVFLNQRDVTFPFIQGNQNVFQLFFQGMYYICQNMKILVKLKHFKLRSETKGQKDVGRG